MPAFLPDAFLAGRSALISGGTSGINLEIAKTLSAFGASVAVFGRDQAKSTAAADAIDAIGGAPALGLVADVRDYKSIHEVASKTAAAFGPLDIVIAGAAGNFPAAAIDISPNGFRAVVEIDLLGTYHLFHASFAYLRKPGASLIAITANQAVRATPFQAHVCAAKAGVNMLVQCLAMEWGPAGIRVNAISPGPIADTEGMARLAPTPDAQARVARAVPLRRYGEKREIGMLAAFLCSDAASYITGSVHNCDGASMHGDATADCLSPTKRAGSPS